MMGVVRGPDHPPSPLVWSRKVDNLEYPVSPAVLGIQVLSTAAHMQW